MSYFIGISGAIEEAGCFQNGSDDSRPCPGCRYCCEDLKSCFTNLSYQRLHMLDELCSIEERKFSDYFPNAQNEIILDGQELKGFHHLLVAMIQVLKKRGDNFSAMPLLKAMSALTEHAISINRGLEISP